MSVHVWAYSSTDVCVVNESKSAKRAMAFMILNPQRDFIRRRHFPSMRACCRSEDMAATIEISRSYAACDSSPGPLFATGRRIARIVPRETLNCQATVLNIYSILVLIMPGLNDGACSAESDFSAQMKRLTVSIRVLAGMKPYCHYCGEKRSDRLRRRLSTATFVCHDSRACQVRMRFNDR